MYQIVISSLITIKHNLIFKQVKQLITLIDMKLVFIKIVDLP